MSKYFDNMEALVLLSAEKWPVSNRSTDMNFTLKISSLELKLINDVKAVERHLSENHRKEIARIIEEFALDKGSEAVKKKNRALVLNKRRSLLLIQMNSLFKRIDEEGFVTKSGG